MYDLKIEDYMDLGKSILSQYQVQDEHTDILMNTLLDADKKAVFTHGFYRLPTYIEQIKLRNIKANPTITKKKSGHTICLIDGDGGLGSVISWYAMNEAIEISNHHGIGIVSVSGSNHFGTAGYYSEMAAMQNKIGIVFTNASPAIAPTGGKKGILGNNPWSISVHTDFGQPITLDIANTIARGKIRLKGLAGEKIPFGWALDRHGQPTDDPAEALDGLLVPIGDHKGYGISLMIEILTGVLSGAQFGTQNPLIDENGKRNNGHLFIALSIESFMALEDFHERLNLLVKMIKDVPRIDEDNEIFLPGEIEWKNKLMQREGMVAIPDNVFDLIKQLCKTHDIVVPKVNPIIVNESN